MIYKNPAQILRNAPGFVKVLKSLLKYHLLPFDTACLKPPFFFILQGFQDFHKGIKKLCPKGFEGLIDIKKPLNHAGFSGLESDTLILFEGEYQTEIRIA